MSKKHSTYVNVDIKTWGCHIGYPKKSIIKNWDMSQKMWVSSSDTSISIKTIILFDPIFLVLK